MKSIIPILFVVFAFGTVSLLAAQENQATTSPSAAPVVASSTAGAVTSEPVVTNSDTRPLEVKPVTTSEPATEPGAPARAHSEKSAVPEGDPNASQNLIEYSGPG